MRGSRKIHPTRIGFTNCHVPNCNTFFSPENKPCRRPPPPRVGSAMHNYIGGPAPGLAGIKILTRPLFLHHSRSLLAFSKQNVRPSRELVPIEQILDLWLCPWIGSASSVPLQAACSSAAGGGGGGTPARDASLLTRGMREVVGCAESGSCVGAQGPFPAVRVKRFSHW